MGYTLQRASPRPPAVLLLPFWRPPFNFSAYAPENIVQFFPSEYAACVKDFVISRIFVSLYVDYEMKEKLFGIRHEKCISFTTY